MSVQQPQLSSSPGAAAAAAAAAVNVGLSQSPPRATTGADTGARHGVVHVYNLIEIGILYVS